MRPTFMGFETSTRALMANQKAIDIIGNNLGNVGVTGYTRQRVDLISVSSNTRYARFANNITPLAGQGVMANGVSQIRDPFLDKRFREESSDVGYYNKLQGALEDIQSALNEITPAPMTEAIKKFEAAWTTLQSDGLNAVNSNSILATARSMVQVFNQFDTKLKNVWQQQKFDLEVDVNSVNSTLQSIANLNEIIKREVFTSSKPGNEYYGPNELLDQRNVLLDQLSLYGEMTSVRQADGTVTVTLGGHTVVEGGKFDTLTLGNGKQKNTVALNWQSTGELAMSGAGALQGAVEMLNGRGSDANAAKGELFEKGILYYQDKINTFAETFAGAFNTLIPEYEPELLPDGTPNPNAWAPTGTFKQLFTFSGEGDPTAGGIQISDEWEKNSAYIIENVHGEGEGQGSTDFMQKALDLFSDKLDFGEFKGSMMDYVTFYSVGTLGNQISSNEARLESSSDICDSLLDKITQISGVSQEEDGVDMMQYTKAFNSISRLMTTMDELMDTLINRTGLVGR